MWALTTDPRLAGREFDQANDRVSATQRDGGRYRVRVEADYTVNRCSLWSADLDQFSQNPSNNSNGDKSQRQRVEVLYLSTKKVNRRDYHLWYFDSVMTERRAIINEEVAYQVRQVLTMEEEWILLEKGKLIFGKV